MIPDYGMLVGQVRDRRQAQTIHDHYELLVQANGLYRAAIDVHSKIFPSQVMFYADEDFTNELTDVIKSFDSGAYKKSDNPNLCIDYVRMKMFDVSKMTPLKVFGDPAGRDLNDKLDGYIDAALQDADSKIYIFGQLFDDGGGFDKDFKFKNEKGIHDVHMNQGNYGSFQSDDGTYQDGAIFIQLIKEEKWIGLFLRFQSQSLETDDNGHATSNVAIPEEQRAKVGGRK